MKSSVVCNFGLRCTSKSLAIAGCAAWCSGHQQRIDGLAMQIVVFPKLSASQIGQADTVASHTCQQLQAVQRGTLLFTFVSNCRLCNLAPWSSATVH